MKNKGFTLVELLIILAVIALLAIVAAVSLTGIRQKSRDTKRVNDMESLQTAMRIIQEETGSYQNACGSDYQGLISQCVGDGTDILLDDYIPSITLMNDPSVSEPTCQTCSSEVCNYSFDYINETDYQVSFYLEKGINDYSAGCHLLTPNGIK